MYRVFYRIGSNILLLTFIAIVSQQATRAALISSNTSTLTSPTHAVDISEVSFSQTIDVNFERHFRDLGVQGSIMIHDLNKTRTYQYNPLRNTTAFSPSSTFKILNSLIALETGVISDEITVLTWDGIQRFLPSWNRDLNMREAFKVSAVWFYQVLSRRVGHEQMQEWVSRTAYGNQQIGSEEDIDIFWLQGDLQITPEEYIHFLKRLHRNDLPFSEESTKIVKDIMIVERTPDYIVRAKTGWTGDVGWYVGYLEQNNNTYFFATNINISDQVNLSKREQLTRLCLQTLGLL